MDPLETNWDKIAFELEEELKRKPVSKEIQKRLMQKYWGMIDIIEDEKRRENTIEKDINLFRYDF